MKEIEYSGYRLIRSISVLASIGVECWDNPANVPCNNIIESVRPGLADMCCIDTPHSALGFVYLPGKIIDDSMDTLYEVLKACKMRI